MSNMKAAEEVETFTSRLDITSVTTKTYEALLELHAATPRAVVTAIGPSGIGKSAIPRQVAKKRNAPYVALHMPTMSIEDWHIPTTAVDTKQYYDKRIPRKFQMLIEYVEHQRKENKGEFPAGKNPILAIEELNRTVDKHVTRAAFTLLDDRMIGDVRLDDAIQIVVTMNPSGGGMAVNEFEKDPAMRRRLVMLGVSCSYSDFIRYAKSHNFHEKIVEHLEAQPTMVYDTEGVLAGKKFACPAAWETASQIAIALEKAEMPLTGNEARAAFAGTIGMSAAERFLDFVQDHTVVITPDEVLRGYTQKSSVRERFQKLEKANRLDKITDLASGIALKIMDERKACDSFGKQLALFMEDMPEEVMIAFIRELSGHAKESQEASKYFTKLSAFMSKEACFNGAVTRLQKAQEKGKAEAEKSG